MKVLYRLLSYVGVLGLGVLLEKTFTVAKNNDPYIFVMIIISTLIMVVKAEIKDN